MLLWTCEELVQPLLDVKVICESLATRCSFSIDLRIVGCIFSASGSLVTCSEGEGGVRMRVGVLGEG